MEEVNVFRLTNNFLNSMNKINYNNVKYLINRTDLPEYLRNECLTLKTELKDFYSYSVILQYENKPKPCLENGFTPVKFGVFLQHRGKLDAIIKDNRNIINEIILDFANF
jgi:hypothetical protein